MVPKYLVWLKRIQETPKCPCPIYGEGSRVRVEDMSMDSEGSLLKIKSELHRFLTVKEVLILGEVL